MSYRWKITWFLFAFQVLVGVVVIGCGFAGIVPEKFIFEKYFAVYQPLMVLGGGAGFLSVFFLLPLAMFVYSYVVARIAGLLRDR